MPRHPRSRYSLNDYNLGNQGELRRGSLEKNDGVQVPFGFKSDGRTLGWLPRNVKRLLLAKNVRFALEWRANLSQPDSFGLTRLFTCTYVHEVGDYGPAIGASLPFGWVRRRELGCDLYRVAPWWYFLQRDATVFVHRLSDGLDRFAKHRGARFE